MTLFYDKHLTQIERFISEDSPTQCAEHLDKNTQAGAALKTIGFDSKHRHLTFRFIAKVINSPSYAHWAALLFPHRAPKITPVAAQSLPATDRLQLVKTCLAAMAPIAQGKPSYAIAHLIAYTKDFSWYTKRGPVPNGRRSWRVWRLLTQHPHFVGIGKTQQWHFIRALLATCPLQELPPSTNILCLKADKMAVSALLNPPSKELAQAAVRLACKVNKQMTSAANVNPGNANAHIVFDCIEASNNCVENRQPSFVWSGQPKNINGQFILRCVDKDHSNGCLLQCPPNFLENRSIFTTYAHQIALFNTTIKRTTKCYNVAFSTVLEIENEAYKFVLGAIVGLYAWSKDIKVTISDFFDLSKRVRIGGRLLWNLLWGLNHLGHGRNKCFAQTIGPRTAHGGLFDPTMPLFNQNQLMHVFTWFHDISITFASNPYTKIVSHFSTLGSEREAPTQHALDAAHRFIIDIHHRHPDIGPNKGVYSKPLMYKSAITKAMQNCTDRGVYEYVKTYFLPNLNRKTSLTMLQHRVGFKLRKRLKTFAMAAARAPRQTTNRRCGVLRLCMAMESNAPACNTMLTLLPACFKAKPFVGRFVLTSLLNVQLAEDSIAYARIRDKETRVFWAEATAIEIKASCTSLPLRLNFRSYLRADFTENFEVVVWIQPKNKSKSALNATQFQGVAPNIPPEILTMIYSLCL